MNAPQPMAMYRCSVDGCSFRVRCAKLTSLRRARRKHRTDTGHTDTLILDEDVTRNIAGDMTREEATHRCIIPGCQFKINEPDRAKRFRALKRHAQELVGHSRLVTADWRPSRHMIALIQVLRLTGTLSYIGLECPDVPRRTIDASIKLGLTHERLIIGGGGRRNLKLTDLGEFFARRLEMKDGRRAA